MDKHFRLRALTLAVSGALILAACGGGEGSASALSGTAAEGLAIANATLTARDAVGNTRSTTTDAGGNYSLDTAGLRFPLMLQITGSKGVWHALVSTDDTGRTANVNNATDSVALLALGLGSSAALQNAFTNGSFREVSAARIAEADARLLDALEQELGTRPASLRIAQLVVVPVLQVAFNVVDSFDESERGAAGFGSTGKH